MNKQPYNFQPQEMAFKFKCGKDSCFWDKGKSCYFFETRNFGTQYNCGLFDYPLYENGDGVIARCQQCKDLDNH